MRRDDEELAGEDEEVCARCGMSKSRWTADLGQGLRVDEETFCCEGCAQDTGCTCEEDRPDLEEHAEEPVQAARGRGSRRSSRK